MGQYLQFRSWLRHSSSGEKALATTAAVAVVGLTAWALVPATAPGGSIADGGVGGPPGAAAGAGAAAGTPTGTSAAAPSTGTAGIAAAPGSGVSGGSATGGASVATAGPAGAAAAGGTTAASAGGGGGLPVGTATKAAGAGPTSGCGRLTSTDVGVTPTQVRIAAVTLDLAGAIGNSAVGLASAQQQQQMAQTVVDDINAHGGVACRKLVVTFYKANPINASTAQQACLNIGQGGYFGAIDIGGLSYPPGEADCVAQKRIPILAASAPVPAEAAKYYPYLMSIAPDPTVDQKNSIFGMARRGWFTAAHGFKKLGVLMDDCSPDIDKATFDALAQVGIPRSQISVAEVACPSGGFAPPGDMEAAVIQHVRDRVTNVIPVIGGGSFKEYSIAAQRQGFKPIYTTTDYDGFEITATGGTGPDVDNFDGTVSVSTTKIGENTSGLNDSATKACMALFKRHGLPESWVMSPSSSMYYDGGGICGQFETFADAIDHDPGLLRAGVAAGLARLGRVPMAFPTADSVFGRARKVTGGDVWWVVQFHKSCTCWKVIDDTLRPSYY